MTKVKAQFFDNRQQKAAKQATRGIENFRLKLYIWTCDKQLHYRHPESNAGDRYYVMYVPRTAYTRKRVGSHFDHLPADARYVGHLNGKHGATRKVFSHLASIDQDWRLHLLSNGEHLDLGLPRSRPADAKPGASLYQWVWPDQFRS